MAIVVFRVNHLKVSGGRGASRAVQYLLREGRYAPQQAEIEYLTRTSVATAERNDLVHKESGNLPAWAYGDAAEFFARAEQYERANGRYATTWQLALPKELTQDEQIGMARDFLAAHLQSHPYLWVVHSPVNEQGDHQPHIHIIFSERTNDVLERKGPADYFKQPQGGGCAKDRWFNQRNAVHEIRAAWCDWTNYTLERAGETARIHPSSLYKRNIDRRPEPKIGPWGDPVAIAERERIRQERDTAKEQALAAEGWEYRKANLGITNVQQIPPQQFARSTMHRARNVQPGQWVPGMPSALVQQHVRRQARQAQAVAQTKRLATEIRILERRQKTIQVPRGREQQQGMIRNGLRADLREEEQGYGR